MLFPNVIQMGTRARLLCVLRWLDIHQVVQGLSTAGHSRLNVEAAPRSTVP
jgi:hypothetical protein